MSELPQTKRGLKAELRRLLEAQHEDEKSVAEMRVTIAARRRRIREIDARLDELDG